MRLLSHCPERDRLYPLIQVSPVCRIHRQIVSVCRGPSPGVTESDCGGGSSGGSTHEKDVRRMVYHNKAAIEGKECIYFRGATCHRPSRYNATMGCPCSSDCQAVHGNRLIIPLRRALIGRRTRSAGMKRRAAKQSQTRPETTLI